MSNLPPGCLSKDIDYEQICCMCNELATHEYKNNIYCREHLDFIRIEEQEEIEREKHERQQNDNPLP